MKIHFIKYHCCHKEIKDVKKQTLENQCEVRPHSAVDSATNDRIATPT